MFEKLIVKVASSLKKHRIPYMIIGGQAVLLYGTPRLTRDIDITLGISTDKLSLAGKAIRDSGLKSIPENIEDFVQKTFVLPAKDEKTGLRVDFIFSYTPYERHAIERASDVTISGVKVKFATVEDIVIHKIFSGRAQDIEDVRAILIKNPDCDASYVKKWLAEFDKTSEGKKFRETFKNIQRQIK